MNKTTIEILRYIFGCDDGSMVRRSGAAMPIVRDSRYHRAALELQAAGLAKISDPKKQSRHGNYILYVAAHNHSSWD